MHRGEEEGINRKPYLDYYHESAEFISPYTLKVGDKTLYSKMIFLCTGSRPEIPPVKGLEEAGYLTSDTVLQLNECSPSLAILGGSYIAAEYGHFFFGYGGCCHGHRKKFQVSSPGRA